MTPPVMSLEKALKMWALIEEMFPETRIEERMAIFSGALQEIAKKSPPTVEGKHG